MEYAVFTLLEELADSLRYTLRHATVEYNVCMVRSETIAKIRKEHGMTPDYMAHVIGIQHYIAQS